MPDQKYLASLTVAATFIEKFGPYLGALLLIVFVLLRTRSMFFLLYRIQILIGGGQAFHNERIQRHWKSYEDMHRLNLWFGLHLRSSQAMHQLFGWLDRHHIAVDDVARCVPYFDANTRAFRFTPPWALWAERMYMWIAAIMLIAGALLFVYADHALVYVNKTRTAFWINSGQASSISYPLTSYFLPHVGWEIDSQYCLFKSDTAPLNDDWDKHVICELVLGNRDDFIREAVDSQRYLSIYLFMLFLIVSVGGVRRSIKRKHAHHVAVKVEADKGLPGQGSPLS